MSFLDDLRRDGQLPFRANYAGRSLLDKGGVLGAPTIVGALGWSRTELGPGVVGAASSSLDYGVAPSCDLPTAGTIMCAFALMGQLPAAGNYRVLLCKKTWTTNRNGYMLYLDGDVQAAVFSISDAAGQINRTYAFSSMRQGRVNVLIGTWDGSSLYFDVNGVSGTTVAQSRNPTSVGQRLYVGNGDNSVASYSRQPIVKAAVISRALTSQERARLYTDVMDEGWVGDPPKRIAYSYPRKNATEYAQQGIFFDSDGRRQGDGRVRDLSPNGYHGTVTGTPTPGSGGEGLILYKNDATEEVNYGDATQMNNATALALECDITFPPGNIPIGYFMVKYTDASNFVIAGAPAAAATPKQLDWFVYNAGSGRLRTTASVLRAGCRQHIMCLFNGLGATNPDKAKVMIDGEEYVCNFISNFPAAAPNMAGAPLLQTQNLGIPSTRNMQRWYNRIVTVAEARAFYLKNFAQRIDWQASGEATPVSLVAAVLAPGRIGEWDIIDGSGVVSESATGRRYAGSGGAGTIITPQPHSDGTWVFTSGFSGTTTLRIGWGLSRATRVGTVDPNQHGYMFHITLNGQITFWRVDNGIGPVVLATSAVGFLAAGNDYRFVVSRRPSDGLFRVWVSGGGLVNAAPFAPVADATWWDAAWFQHQSNIQTDKLLIHDPRKPGQFPTHFVGPLDPTAGEVPG